MTVQFHTWLTGSNPFRNFKFIAEQAFGVILGKIFKMWIIYLDQYHDTLLEPLYKKKTSREPQYGSNPFRNFKFIAKQAFGVILGKIFKMWIIYLDQYHDTLLEPLYKKKNIARTAIRCPENITSVAKCVKLPLKKTEKVNFKNCFFLHRWQ